MAVINPNADRIIRGMSNETLADGLEAMVPESDDETLTVLATKVVKEAARRLRDLPTEEG